MKKLQTLEELLKAVDCKQEFNIVDDLKSLESSYGIIKSKDFRKKLSALVRKYEESELTEIRSAVIKGCRDGNSQFVRLYVDYFMPSAANVEDDGLIEVLTAKGEEAFRNE